MRIRSVLVGLVLALFAASPCFAGIDLGFSGVGSVGSDYIDFGATPTTGPYAAAPGYGQFLVTSPIGGIFAANGVITGDTGNIESIQNGVAFVQPFITFNDSSGIELDISTISTGNVPNSPFTLNDTPSGAVASFYVTGTIAQPAGTNLNFTALFSATFAGMTVSELTNPSLLPIDTPFSATINVVPEPASLALLASGCLLLLWGCRKRTASC